MRLARLPTCLLVAFLLVRTGLTKDPDEDKPYKFGFNIEGYQHRQEEKDEKGIIKGEYGFITADGYYRVTVYATDENGDFRIISMKNYYVGFPPEDPQTTPQPPTRSGGGRQPLTRGFGPAPNPLTVPPDGRDTSKPEKKGKDPIELLGLTGCSDCVIPTTKKPGSATRGGTGGRNGGGGFGVRNQSGPSSADRGNAPAFGGKTPGGVSIPGRIRSGEEGNSNPKNRGNVENNFATPRRGGPETVGSRRDNPSSGGFNREPGTVRDGLPRGVTLDDVKALLYTFNYTVGFHGHHEDGYRNGDKEGDFFVDGRDGVERKVEYLANEFGYQPNITFVDLPANDVRIPNERTEKEFGLKGYEFKWFYKK